MDALARFNRETVPHAFDALNYFYEKDQFGNPLRNRLYHHWDAGDDSFVTESVDGVADLPMLVTTFEDDHDLINTANNYSYDAMGNLIRDVKENITLIDWTPTGKVDFVHRQDADPFMALDFRYDGTGQRVEKDVLEDDDGPLVKAEHYVRDAQGNIMGVYTYDLSGGPPAKLTLANRPIYGSSRAGVDNEPVELMGVSYPAPLPNELFHIPGSKQYELTDHLGNVHVTISDVHLPMESAIPDDEADYYLPQVLSAMDYEPFGSLLPGRNYSSDSYRFGFNGKENDNEVHGSMGTSLDFGDRLYDSRVGRWISPDPEAALNPFKSCYAGFSDNPIVYTDPKGRTEFYFNGKWVGTDGIKNIMVAVVTSSDLAKEITKLSKKGNIYSAGEISNGMKTDQFFAVHIDIVKESFSLLSKAEKETRYVEYKATMDGNDADGYKETFSGMGAVQESISATDKVVGGELPPGDISLHSHPTAIEVKDRTVWAPNAANPSPDDKSIFKDYKMNVIVGKRGDGHDVETRDVITNMTLGLTKFEVTDNRPLFMFFYSSDSKMIGGISKNSAGTIVNGDRGDIGEKFDKAKPK